MRKSEGCPNLVCEEYLITRWSDSKLPHFSRPCPNNVNPNTPIVVSLIKCTIIRKQEYDFS